jgi:opacity protein-like surface antigen
MLLSFQGFAQKWKLTRYEFMFGIGPANYFGDIGGSASTSNWYGIKDISIKTTRPSFFGAARYKIKENMSIKVNMDLLFLGGNDNGSKQQILYGATYAFNTIAFEHSAQFEYSFLTEDRHRYSFALFNRRGMVNNFSRINFYAYAGIGGLAFKPYISGTSKTPQNDLVSNSFGYTAVIPAGLGLKYVYSNRMSLNAEWGARYSLSDYLDGLSSKTSHFPDVYYLTTIALVYRIRSDRRGYPILFRNNGW